MTLVPAQFLLPPWTLLLAVATESQRSKRGLLNVALESNVLSAPSPRYGILRLVQVLYSFTLAFTHSIETCPL
jgi:hypothetical protein